MKRKVLVLSVIILMSTFVFGIGAQNSMAADKSKYGGILKMNHAKEAANIGLPPGVRAWNHEFGDIVCQALLERTTEQPGVAARLATNWRLAPDKSHYIFNLRKGVKFHDGTDFNASAAKWALNLYEGSTSTLFSEVKSIDVIDDYTLKINLSSYNSLVITDFAQSAYMISPTAFEKYGPKKMESFPVGTGAFRITENKRKAYMKFEKFGGYWEKKDGDQLPYVDGIKITTIVDSMTAIAVMKNRDVDVLMGVDYVSASELLKAGNYDADWIPGPVYLLAFNSTDPNSLWSDKKMRYALDYAINKESITKNLGYGFVEPVNEIVAFCSGNPKKTIREYNPAKARQLLKEAGYPNGVKVTMAINAEWPKDFPMALQNNLSEAGIQLEIQPVRGAALLQKFMEVTPGSELRMQHIPRGHAFLNEISFIRDQLASNAIQLPGMKRPKELDSLLHKALQMTEPEQMISTIEKIEELAYEDAMYVPLWNLPLIFIKRNNIKDAVFIEGGVPHPRLQTAWIEK